MVSRPAFCLHALIAALAAAAAVLLLASTAARAQVPDTADAALPDTAAVQYRAPDVVVDTLFDRSAYDEALRADSAAAARAPLPAPSELPATTRAEDTLSLDAAVERALQQNPTLRIARGRSAIAEENHTLGNAGLLPYADLTLRRSRRPGFGSGGGGGSSGDLGGGAGSGSQATTSLSLDANYTLFEGFGRLYAYRRLEEREDEAGLRAGYEAERVIADVVAQYYELARRQQQVRVFKSAVALAREQLRIARARAEVGLAPELAVRQARIDRNEDRAALAEERAALAEAQATFNQLLDRTDAPGVVAAENLDPGPALALPALTEDALARNRALRAERQALQAARLRIEEAEAEWWPRVGLTAGYNFNDLFVENVGLQTAPPGGFSYGLTATFDVFEGFNRERRIDVASLEARNRTFAIDRIETRLQTALQSAYERYRRARSRVRLALKNLDAARLNVEGALARYRLGTITFVEVREVQNTLTRLRSRLLQAQFDAKRAETDLLLLSGRLLERFR